MDIKEVLQHKWFKKFYNKIIEARQGQQGSPFKMYSTSEHIPFKGFQLNQNQNYDDEDE